MRRVESETPQILRVGIDDAPPVRMQIGAPESGDFMNGTFDYSNFG